MPKTSKETSLPLRPWFRRRLLDWFARHARPLPWRQTRDPYAIWISEVMLQQTQVATVIPFYKRFLQSFPDLASLAAADLESVLRHWQGLGYYRRARNLHLTARALMADHQGRFPRDPALLRALPGLGRYTVNAVLSQAFDARLPILEANSARVLCRLLGFRADPKTGPTQKRLWQAAADLLPARQTGQFNQAMMELGALVCVPDKPRCHACPLHRHCRAFQEGTQADIPLRGKPAAVVAVREVALVIKRKKEVLLVQRPDTGRWAHLWEFPHLELSADENHRQAAERLLATLAIKAALGPEITTLRHAVTRFHIHLRCLEAAYRAGCFHKDFYIQAKWVTPNHLHRYPLSSPHRRLAETLTPKS